MDELLQLNEELALNLEKYASDLATKAYTINKGINQMMNRHLHLDQGRSDKFWSSPLNSYSLIRHMQSDWSFWSIYMEKPVGLDKITYLESMKPSLPQKWDFEDAAKGIRSMQGVYGMSAKDIAKGLLNGVQYKCVLILVIRGQLLTNFNISSSFTARECLELGLYLMNDFRWLESEEWIYAGLAALDRADTQSEMHLLRAPKKSLLYRTLARNQLMQNKLQEGLSAYQAALKESPHDAEFFEEFQFAETSVLTKPKIHLNSSKLEESIKQDNLLYTRCCNGHCQVDRKLRLYCVYNTTASPFYRLAPLKVEILSKDPHIVIFHDIVSVEERKRIRKGSKSYLIASSTFNMTTGTYHIETTRTSKSVWIQSNSNNLSQKLTDVMEEATGLDMNYSEMFQVINYGVGGVFEVHFDTLLRDEDRFNGTEDRIATLLYYLSDVPQGGATVFPSLNLTVFPQPGSVLFWYNLDNKGNEDLMTHHLGCPLIVGSKWVMTKWINDLGQEFRRPCVEL
ncbi:prolyl 4-hydroxylase subunit alpha-1-like isoform X1 [Drosophila elegans]|uniref:prolyl 4-hydroxylase subunit alpha-1-like isoform X1 n=1 Tax=Drosophila elegans TaxID=30023 RepID=UPI0007E5CD2C|nr:prolyl 4-hydroxylase subunit alpha-1-like isoform X1 [Drosophila elegans]